MQTYANAYDNDNEYDKENDLKEKDSFGVQKESVSAPPQPTVEIPLKDGTPYSVPESDLKEYQALYPGLDVIHECQKAARWCRDNPARQKTRQGVKRFLGSWLSRAAADSALVRRRPGSTADSEKKSGQTQKACRSGHFSTEDNCGDGQHSHLPAGDRICAETVTRWAKGDNPCAVDRSGKWVASDTEAGAGHSNRELCVRRCLPAKERDAGKLYLAGTCQDGSVRICCMR